MRRQQYQLYMKPLDVVSLKMIPPLQIFQMLTLKLSRKKSKITWLLKLTKKDLTILLSMNVLTELSTKEFNKRCLKLVKHHPKLLKRLKKTLIQACTMKLVNQSLTLIKKLILYMLKDQLLNMNQHTIKISNELNKN